MVSFLISLGLFVFGILIGLVVDRKLEKYSFKWKVCAALCWSLIFLGFTGLCIHLGKLFVIFADFNLNSW